MFMFRSRRSNLSKRLWKARVKRGGGSSNNNETECETQISTNNRNQSPPEYMVFDDLYGNNNSFEDAETVVRTDVLKKLKDHQLEMLLVAVESRGADLSDCVLVPRGDTGDTEAHVRCCQVWRWPDLRHAAELKRLPMCGSAKDPVYICCNPYHWSRLCQPDTPPPPYSLIMDRLKPEDRAPSEGPQDYRRLFPGSLTTNGEDPEMNSRVWCKLAYWELTQRVGRLFPVEVPAVNVFSAQPHGDGLCLSTLAQHSFSPPESVKRTRAKIGLGVTLSQEMDGVWVYNRSDSPIFVNSPTLEEIEPHSVTVYRVGSGYSLCIFDYSKAAAGNFGWNFTNFADGPVDRNSVRISFAKGWGPNYSRPEVTACPCWLEVLLAPCR